MSEKFDIYSKIFFRDVENFVRHLCVLVLRHQMRVSNYFVNSFYSEVFSSATNTMYQLVCLMLHILLHFNVWWRGLCSFKWNEPFTHKF
jgi:hypothetical protein